MAYVFWGALTEAPPAFSLADWLGISLPPSLFALLLWLGWRLRVRPRQTIYRATSAFGNVAVVVALVLSLLIIPLDIWGNLTDI